MSEPEIKVNLPKIEISVGTEATKIKTESTTLPMVIPATPVASMKDNGEVDPPDTQEVIRNIRDLTNKSVLIALKKVTEMLQNMKDIDPEKFVNLTLRLMDAQMAFDWSDRFAKTILKNPALLKGMAGGNRTGTAQGNMSKLKKIAAGDGRTTPKRLIKDLPKDEDESEVG